MKIILKTMILTKKMKNMTDVYRKQLKYKINKSKIGFGSEE